MNLSLYFIASFIGALIGTMVADLALRAIERRRIRNRFKVVQARLDSLLVDACYQGNCECDE